MKLHDRGAFGGVSGGDGSCDLPTALQGGVPTIRDWICCCQPALTADVGAAALSAQAMQALHVLGLLQGGSAHELSCRVACTHWQPIKSRDHAQQT